MLKVKDKVYSRIMQSNLSRVSLTMMLDFIQFADIKGKVDVYYKKYIELANISVSQFYSVLKLLEEKKLIKTRKNVRKYISVEVVGNSFEDGYKNYRNINIPFFTDRTYAELPGGMIRMQMRAIQACAAKAGREIPGNKNKIRYVSDAFQSFANICKLKVSTVKAYFHDMEEKKLIKFYERKSLNGASFIEVRSSLEKKYSNEFYTHDSYLFSFLVSEIGAKMKFYEEHVNLVNQYRKMAEKAKLSIEQVLKYVLLKLKSSCGCDDENIEVTPAHFNLLLKSEIELFKQRKQPMGLFLK